MSSAPSSAFYGQVRGWRQPVEVSPSDFLAVLRRYLVLVGVHGARQLSLKAFRAGKATALATGGCSVAEILLAGEWRSSVFLRYVSEERVDQAMLLQQSIDGSDAE